MEPNYRQLSLIWHITLCENVTISNVQLMRVCVVFFFFVVFVLFCFFLASFAVRRKNEILCGVVQIIQLYCIYKFLTLGRLFVSSNPVLLPELYFDSFSYPVACIVFGDMAIGSLFLLLLFSQSQILSGKVQACSKFSASALFLKYYP